MDMDNSLVLNIQKGDKKALATLVERHKKAAYRMALGLVGNSDDAWDISQEAFLRVYRSAGTFDTSQPFMPWFYTIVSNLAKTWLRKKSRTTTVDFNEQSWLLVDEETPETTYEKQETLGRLREALMQLSFQDREIITLQHFRNMSYDEIAALLKIPKGTVMSRLYYARKRLANLMKGENDV